MKRFVILLLLAVNIFYLSGCQKEAPTPQGSAFYYCATDISFGMDNTTILAEYRQSPAQDTLQQMLTKYFAGPSSADLRSPFPVGLKLVAVEQDGQTVYITVSDALASLSGLDLTLACACITLTCLDFTGADQVMIYAQDALLDGQKTITMDRKTLLLLDTVLDGE